MEGTYLHRLKEEKKIRESQELAEQQIKEIQLTIQNKFTENGIDFLNDLSTYIKNYKTK